jgi:hypothetical protein
LTSSSELSPANRERIDSNPAGAVSLNGGKPWLGSKGHDSDDSAIGESSYSNVNEFDPEEDEDEDEESNNVSTPASANATSKAVRKWVRPLRDGAKMVKRVNATTNGTNDDQDYEYYYYYYYDYIYPDNETDVVMEHLPKPSFFNSTETTEQLPTAVPLVGVAPREGLPDEPAFGEKQIESAARGRSARPPPAVIPATPTQKTS